MTLPITPERLRAHVVRLAEEIGERNVFRPGALAAAADYIAEQWRGFGYRVARQEYRVQGVRCANLEVERPSRMLSGLPAESTFYYVHSYEFRPGSPELRTATTDYGKPVTACVELGSVFGVQFHPEKSQADGLRLLRNFIGL